jgi:hypothetical protein
MAGKAWADAEVLLLESLAGYQTVETIAQRLNRINTKAGRPHRSPMSVRSKLARLKMSGRCILDNFPRDELVNLLGIPRTRARRWTEKLGLPSKKGKALITIKADQFREWAYANPQYLFGIDADRLNWLMDDLDFCKRCERLPSPTYGVKQAIVRLSDGKVFESIELAARENFVDSSSIRKALRTGVNCLGSKWRYRDRQIEEKKVC